MLMLSADRSKVAAKAIRLWTRGIHSTVAHSALLRHQAEAKDESCAVTASQGQNS